MPLPEFTLAATFTPSTARHDKVRLLVEPHLAIRCTAEELVEFRDFLSVPPQGTIDLDGLYGTLFNRPRGNHGRQLKNTIRSSRQGAPTSEPLAVFGGSYQFFPVSAHNGGRVTTRLVLDLSANPTRLVRYQQPGYLPPQNGFANSGARMTTGEHPECDGEFSLDNSDNWIPDTAAFEPLNQPQLWPSHLRVSIEGALHRIEQEVERAKETVHQTDPTHSVSMTMEHIPSQNRFNLREVETYWEFQADYPLESISDIEPMLHTFNEMDVGTTHYKNETLGNGISVTVPIRAGVELKVYAKTNRRIRFEVVHDLQECSTPAHILSSPHDPHTFPSLERVYGKLELLRQDAAEIMNTVFQHMRQQNTLPTTPKRALHLLYDISQAVPDPEIARILIWALVINRRVVSMPPLSPHLKELKRQGILEIQPRNRKRAYVVTAPYRFALEAIASNCNYPLLTTRHRSRASPSNDGHS